MDAATVTIPCQRVDLNNNCQCRSVAVQSTRTFRPMMVLQIKQGHETATLTRIVRSSAKRHGVKWHPYKMESQPPATSAECKLKPMIRGTHDILETAINLETEGGEKEDQSSRLLLNELEK
uniref:Uncharacterized protein n=1 Tax=Anopheles farauti TaxID=69004 RepID=A0A182QWJ9_9DIPT